MRLGNLIQFHFQDPDVVYIMYRYFKAFNQAHKNVFFGKLSQAEKWKIQLYSTGQCSDFNEALDKCLVL